jgi:uncharacterized short protein YbdD (DUF466 family)
MRLTARLREAARVLRVVVGAPDYERYVAHMRAHHPGARPLARDAFLRDRERARYSRPGSRCC